VGICNKELPSLVTGINVSLEDLITGLMMLLLLLFLFLFLFIFFYLLFIFFFKR
jgi:hypothetical protein